MSTSINKNVNELSVIKKIHPHPLAPPSGQYRKQYRIIPESSWKENSGLWLFRGYWLIHYSDSSWDPNHRFVLILGSDTHIIITIGTAHWQGLVQWTLHRGKAITTVFFLDLFRTEFTGCESLTWLKRGRWGNNRIADKWEQEHTLPIYLLNCCGRRGIKSWGCSVRKISSGWWTLQFHPLIQDFTVTN